MKKICLVFTVLFSLFSSFGVGADDTEVVDLKAIDAKIKETDYNQALLMLEAYIKRSPDKFDAAQKRIRKIMKAREEYASLSKELIDVIRNEPENNQKKLDIIARLEALEKSPTAEALAFISQAKIAAQFTYYRSVFNNLMEIGSALVAEEKYVEAVNKIREGFYLYQDEFFASTSDTEITDIVKKSLFSVDTAISSLPAVQDDLNNACKNFIEAVKSDDYNRSMNAFASVRHEFGRLATVRNTVFDSGLIFESAFSDMKKLDPKLTDSSFLPFVSRLTLGRTSDPDSGIVGAMDAQWNTLTEQMKNSVYEQMVAQSKTFEESLGGEKVFTSGDGVRSDILFSIKDFALLAKEVNGLYTLKNSRHKGENIYPQYDYSMQFVTSLSENILKQLDLIALQRREKSRSESIVLPQDIVLAFRSEKTNYGNLKFSIAPVFEKIKTDSENIINSQWFASKGILPEKISESPPEETSRTTAGVFIADEALSWQTAENILLFLCTKTASLAESEAVKDCKEGASYFAAAGDLIADRYETQYAWAEELMTARAENRTAPDGKVLEAGSYPSEALALVTNLKPSVLSDRALLSDSQKILETKTEYQNYFADTKKILSDSIERLDRLNLRGTEISERAQERILLAESASNEGDLRYEQSVRALSRSDFNGAREYLQRSRLKYNESLSYQESKSLRVSSNEKLLKLGERIASKENEVVVAEVRQLKSKARSEYYAGNFEEAENLLVRARTRWATTNIDEDVEISNLYSMVITALSMQTGRTILPTAPLYPEMSQILSIANQYYDQGRELMASGRKAEAEAVLQQSKDKLHELQLVYPLNQEASLLTLRINKLIDEDAFNDMFRRRVDSARSDYKNPSLRQRAYADLLDLYTINPGYPGLKRLIYDVEVEIGIRQRPVDRAVLARSSALTSDARKIVDTSRNEVELRRALSLVDEAISLNPQNSDAITLKDRIQVSIGGKATVVLSAEDEMLYQQAIQELQNNNIIGAYALVQRLLQSPVNSRSAKVLDLQKKVQALL
ncbi:hypothetical protein [Treponema parvum]|uniref:hypothetical protein n=1 Tax=Treponema parvum TaxID=138851 RepID=UPI001AEBD1CE|nr:hypothetical protein [Treponema parvum]QTQ16084.1 hypothetical protein HXT04_04875 [Treponema parvum]